MIAAFKLLITALIIVFTSWLANKKPVLAGFIISLPMSSLIALSLNYIEFKDMTKTSLFAKSILVSVPLTLVFFLPFIFSERLKLPFWGALLSGIVLVLVSYKIHSIIFES